MEGFERRNSECKESHSGFPISLADGMWIERMNLLDIFSRTFGMKEFEKVEAERNSQNVHVHITLRAEN